MENGSTAQLRSGEIDNTAGFSRPGEFSVVHQSIGSEKFSPTICRYTYSSAR